MDAAIYVWCTSVVGFDEIIFIGVIALLLFGPDKLPEYIRELGRLFAEMKKAQRDFELEINKAALVSTPPEKKPPSQTVLEIARKMNIPVEGKTEDQLLLEIDITIGEQKDDEARKVLEAETKTT